MPGGASAVGVRQIQLGVCFRRMWYASACAGFVRECLPSGSARPGDQRQCCVLSGTVFEATKRPPMRWLVQLRAPASR